MADNKELNEKDLNDVSGGIGPSGNVTSRFFCTICKEYTNFVTSFNGDAVCQKCKNKNTNRK